MSAHTPGPWIDKVVADGDEVRHVIRGNGDTVNVVAWSKFKDCLNKKSFVENEANARLIVAAPDFAEAFAKLCAIVGQPGDAAEVPDAMVGRVAKAIVREYTARAAIAKSVGK